jgi:hypothetical protein
MLYCDISHLQKCKSKKTQYAVGGCLSANDGFGSGKNRCDPQVFTAPPQHSAGGRKEGIGNKLALAESRAICFALENKTILEKDEVNHDKKNHYPIYFCVDLLIDHPHLSIRRSGRERSPGYITSYE